jgi:hypothetical protein
VFPARNANIPYSIPVTFSVTAAAWALLCWHKTVDADLSVQTYFHEKRIYIDMNMNPKTDICIFGQNASAQHQLIQFGWGNPGP